MRTRLLLVVLLVAFGCPHRPASPTAELEAAARQGAGADARTQALAGFHALLVAGEPEQARARFDAALGKDAREPWAHFGQHLLALRSGQPELALTAALTLIERAPGHPLAVTAARYTLDMAGQSPVLDTQLRERLPKLLALGVGPDTAHLLRSALAGLHALRREDAALEESLAAMGVPRSFSVVGPLTAFHWLDFDAPLEAERTGSLSGPFRGPPGEVPPRTLPFPDGRLLLSGEGGTGDVYLVAVDVAVEEAGPYVVRAQTPSGFKLYVDGTQLLERRPFQRASSFLQQKAVQLSAGRHRLLVKLVREESAFPLTLSVLRADGRPARLVLTPATGPAPSWRGVPEAQAAGLFPGAEDVLRALQPETGEALARVVAARDAMARDHDGALRVLAPLDGVLSSPAFLTLRAELALQDRSIPSRVAQGRAARDLEAAAGKDPGEVTALLARATLALEGERATEAAALLEAARKAHTPPGYPVLMAEARVSLALNVEAQAEARAREAMEVLPGLCSAARLRYELARRRDAVRDADALVREPLALCPGGLELQVEHARMRGQLARAAELAAGLAVREPTSLQAANRLAQVLVGQGKSKEAAEALARLRTFWPRNPLLLKRLADVRELAGERDAALALREEALLMDGGDLTLRRAVVRVRTGKELLQEYAIDAKEAIRAYEAAPGVESTAATYVLDAAAVQVYPDGSQVSRVHTIQKVLAQGGVSELAEVTLPAGAQVLALRTLKADGRVLEPEDIENKETVSMPAVEVGDYVQTEYLLAEGPRPPSQPGFAAAPFYFQLAGQPNNWSTYTVLAPKSVGMEVDAHNVQAPPVRQEGDTFVFVHEERRVPPFIPEPDAPPNPNEFLPFVQVGAGTEGQESLVATYADAFLDNGAVTFEVERFAKEAAAGRKGLEAVKAVYAAVAQRLTGRDAGLGQSATSSIAQDRGSRLWALRAALEALGFSTRVAMVRTFNTDPAPYRFPNPQLLTYVALRVEVPEVGQVWLDPAVRFGPFGELPELASGVEAWLMPEPGKAVQKVQTPPPASRVDKDVKLALSLAEDGVLSGTVTETYLGFDGAQLAEALEELPGDRRKQAFEQSLSRYFGGLEVTSLDVNLVREVGRPLVVTWSFRASQAARREGEGRMLLTPLTFPANLGGRFVQVGRRTTPLFISDTERSRTEVSLTLPQGWRLGSLIPPVEQKTPFGTFRRTESLDGSTLRIVEELTLERGRIPPEQYEAFSSFAGNVDLVQTRDFPLTKGTPAAQK